MIAILLALGTALAEPPPPPSDDVGPGLASEDDRMMRHWSEIADKLGLDDKQRDDVEKLYFDNKSARIDSAARAEKARLELERLMRDPASEEKAIMKAFDAQVAAENELRENRLMLHLGLRKVLKPEQWEQLISMREERRGGRQGARGRAPTGD
ncbi:MAG: periplasmic heavy metal sensor [Deltaproteobacteria bacterium]|nr:periplasmic heavy metal sensor [Deltaproteobacteria bacterium]